MLRGMHLLLEICGSLPADGVFTAKQLRFFSPSFTLVLVSLEHKVEFSVLVPIYCSVCCLSSYPVIKSGHLSVKRQAKTPKIILG